MRPGRFVVFPPSPTSSVPLPGSRHPFPRGPHAMSRIALSETRSNPVVSLRPPPRAKAAQADEGADPPPTHGRTPGLRGTLPLPSPFVLERGGALEGGKVAFELCGNPLGPLVAVLGGISADGHVCPHAGDPRPGWWSGVVGPGAVLDPGRYRILGVDYLAGPGASSGPPADPEAPFPPLTPGDQAAALVTLLDHLGVRRFRAVVGGSYGGMVGLALAQRFPHRVERVVALAAAHEPDPMAAALRSVQRSIVRSCARRGGAEEGLALARALAATTDRSREEFRTRFPGAGEVTEDGTVRVPAEDYLEHQGRQFVDRITPGRFVALSASIDLHRVDPSALRTPVTLVGFLEDAIVPPESLRELAPRLPPGSTFSLISSRYGHDGFLKEVEPVSRVIRRALATAALEAGDPP